MLEKMNEFFAARLDGYDAHMLDTIEGAREFYPYTASLLPKARDAKILDLGCGTGLELEAYYAQGGDAAVTGIDLSAAMLGALSRKFPDRAIRTVCGSYFDVPLGEAHFDAAVSVESLHHFPALKKRELYRRLRAALKPGAVFVLTDYFARTEEEEREGFAAREAMRRSERLPEGLYHYDTPLTCEHEMELLNEAGFCTVTELCRWGATAVVRAIC